MIGRASRDVKRSVAIRAAALSLAFGLALAIGGLDAGAQRWMDEEAPVIVMCGLPVPRGISGGDADSECRATVSFTATITDNCCIQTESVVVTARETTGNGTLGELRLQMTHIDSPPSAPEGQSVVVEGSVDVTALTGCPAAVEVTIRATDCSGNEAGAVTWTADVTDSTAPFLSWPADIAKRGCGVTLDPGVATASDNCDPAPVVVGTRSDGLALTAPYPCGTTTITWTATDRCGNQASGVQQIRISTRPPSGGGGGGSSGGTVGFGSPSPSAGSDASVCVSERVCLVGYATDPEQGTEGLKYQWSFAVRYYLNGVPVLDVPPGSQAASTAEGFDNAAACFVADVPGQYRLLLTVCDRDGLCTMDSATVTASPCGQVYSCPYQEGWNLLSIAAQPLSPDAQGLLEETSADTPALAYEGGHYFEADVLSPAEGFWVHFVTADAISFIGREVRNDVTLELVEPGWHLISSPFAVDWERVLVFVNGAERYVGDDVARDVIDESCVCFDPTAQLYRSSDQILPCQGYWVRTYEPNVRLKMRWTGASSSLAGLSGCEGEITSSAPLPPGDLAARAKAVVLAYPNPVRHSVVHFEVPGDYTTDRVRVGVYSLSGEIVWEGEADSNVVEWEPRDEMGEPLPWGPYAFCVSAWQDGAWSRVGCGVVFLLEED